MLSNISNLRIKPSFRIYFHLPIFSQQHIRADVTQNIATTPSPNVMRNLQFLSGVERRGWKEISFGVNDWSEDFLSAAVNEVRLRSKIFRRCR